ncbi:hypothetical protein QAD02_019468 [Eretmocerus hayati]|uniref:Uncharacterized protein n=1 Tax=Eretmocerus hayati TaxID=131215 RepID=A0ACC2PJQ3_9HYME|nr:hypothetical protein QAD02_019468 [Eretmocerus hayati]
MDVSTLFKASVKTISLCDEIVNNQSKKTSGLKINRKQSLFTMKAKMITSQIAKLYELLLENRQAYLNFHNFLSTKAYMTDAERDEIDLAAQETISVCSKLIKELRREVILSDISQQNQEHQEIVIIVIEEYLKRACRIYSEQKALRVKQAIEMKKISKLEPLKAKDSNDVKKLNATESMDTTENMNEASVLKIQEINGDVSGVGQSENEQFSSEDIQVFEAENEQLYNELNTLTEEIAEIESKVVHISELQEIFTEKVMDQDKNLERVLTTVVGSTENVIEANEQIRKAIQRNAGLRVWVLFFLLVMSFTLIFLDWYNP